MKGECFSGGVILFEIGPTVPQIDGSLIKSLTTNGNGPMANVTSKPRGAARVRVFTAAPEMNLGHLRSDS